MSAQKISICFSPALFPFYFEDNSIAIIVDIFRATTSICAAFQNGASAVRTISSIEEAAALQKQGLLVAAERNTKKCDFADFGNSPFDFIPEKVQGKEIVFTTTNGTRAALVAMQADEILIGAFSNISSLREYCLNKSKNIILVCSGWNNQFCIEDTLFAAAFAEKLMTSSKFQLKSDASMAAFELWKIAKTDIKSYICKSEHYERLVKNGYENEVDYCLTSDVTPVIPIYDRKKDVFSLKQRFQ